MNTAVLMFSACLAGGDPAPAATANVNGQPVVIYVVCGSKDCCGKSSVCGSDCDKGSKCDKVGNKCDDGDKGCCIKDKLKDCCLFEKIKDKLFACKKCSICDKGCDKGHHKHDGGFNLCDHGCKPKAVKTCDKNCEKECCLVSAKNCLKGKIHGLCDKVKDCHDKLKDCCGKSSVCGDDCDKANKCAKTNDCDKANKCDDGKSKCFDCCWKPGYLLHKCKAKLCGLCDKFDDCCDKGNKCDKGCENAPAAPAVVPVAPVQPADPKKMPVKVGSAYPTVKPALTPAGTAPRTIDLTPAPF